MKNPNVASDVEQKVELIQLRTVLEHNLIALFAIVVNSTLFLVVNWNAFPNSELLAWYALMNGIVVLRFLLQRTWFKRLSDPSVTSEAVRRMRIEVTAGIFVVGLLWGSIGLFFYHPLVPPRAAFAVFLIAGMTAGAVVSYSVIRDAMTAFLVPAIIPITAKFAFLGDNVSLIMAFITVLYGVLMWLLGKRLNVQIRDSLLLRFENEHLLRSLNLSLEASGAMSWAWIPSSGQAFASGNTELVPSFTEHYRSIFKEDRSKLRKVISRSKNFDLEYGTYTGRYYAARGEVRRNPKGKIERITGVLWDITVKKAQENLRKQKEEAEMANRAKSELLANASHEIRTPVAAISGFASLLAKKGRLTGENLEYASIIERNSKHLETLVSDLIDLSRSEAGAIENPKGLFPIVKEVLGVLAMFRPETEKKKIALRTSFIGFIPDQLFGDVKAFRQILINLVSNAVKFTDSGSVHLEVQMLRPIQKKHPPRLSVLVTDSGIGIPEEFVKNLFQPFSRGIRPEILKKGGSGLGLALSKNLANNLGGDVRLIKSIVNGGSTFEFIMNVEHADEIAFHKHKISGKTPICSMPQSDRPLSGAKIVVAEDDVDLQRLLKDNLETAGAEVDICENGLEAVKTVGSRHPDLVLMDLKMPLLGGVEATKRIRALGFDKPVIALTAFSAKEDQEQCYRAGFDDFLSKSFGLPQLVETAHHYVAHSLDPRFREI